GPRWKTRMFGPGLGVAEDPATGSAAGPLAVHLARHGRIAWGDEIEITQGVEIKRPSKLYARAEGADGAVERVEVGGSAAVIARGPRAGRRPAPSPGARPMQVRGLPHARRGMRRRSRRRLRSDPLRRRAAAPARARRARARRRCTPVFRA